MVNIAIVGYGGMGQVIKRIAEEKGITVKSIVDPISKDATHKEISEQSMKGVDVAIDFTHPSAVLSNIKAYCSLKQNVVIGTTGWYDQIKEVKSMATEAGINFLWGSNFSIGVHMYFKIIDHATKIANKAKDYDVWGFELHHNKKADSPSGTAVTLTNTILKNIDRKKTVVNEKLDRQISPEELHFASIRGGSANFEHTIGIDSEADCITIKHAARNRDGYASGAVEAALWLKNKKAGFYDINDFVDEVLEGKE